MQGPEIDQLVPQGADPSALMASLCQLAADSTHSHSSVPIPHAKTRPPTYLPTIPSQPSQSHLASPSDQTENASDSPVVSQQQPSQYDSAIQEECISIIPMGGSVLSRGTAPVDASMDASEYLVIRPKSAQDSNSTKASTPFPRSDDDASRLKRPGSNLHKSFSIASVSRSVPEQQASPARRRRNPVSMSGMSIASMGIGDSASTASLMPRTKHVWTPVEINELIQESAVHVKHVSDIVR